MFRRFIAWLKGLFAYPYFGEVPYREDHTEPGEDWVDPARGDDDSHS